MNPLIAKIGLMLISRKINDNPLDVQNSDFDKKEIIKAAPAWVAIIGFIVLMLNSTGHINDEQSKAVNDLISNPDVQMVIESAL